MSNRLITPQTIALVESMANDLALPRGLRDFHTAQLANLRRRSAEQHKPVRSNPFDRFIQQLSS